MIGHPSETLEDVQAIADLCKAVLAEGRKVISETSAQVHAGVSTFVPKPHTPFQWVPCDTREQILAKQAILKRELRGKNFSLTWTKPEDTMLEAWLSRGDRRLSEVIYLAWKHGAKFDAWQEHFNYDAWMQAFQQTGLDPAFYTHRPRQIDEAFPWEHISTAVRRKFLTEDYLWSLQGKVRIDCRERCFACGILPMFADMRREYPGDAWQCPEVKRRQAKQDLIPLETLFSMRLRITFAKTDEMRFTGHLDLHRTWERIFRRAGLPLAYSQGFHPQPAHQPGLRTTFGFYQ